MKNDPIVDEVRKIRQLHAESFDHDLRRIVEDLRRTEGRRDRGESPLLDPVAKQATAASASRGVRFANR